MRFSRVDEVEDERRHHQADRVVDEEGGEDAGDQDDRHEEDQRMARPRDDEAVDQPEEAGEAQIGGDDHHAEEERDRLEVDGAIGLAEAEHAEPDHEARAEQRGAGPVEPVAGQLADGDDEIGGGEDEDGGEHGGGRFSNDAGIPPAEAGRGTA